ncbi:MAG: riboflavin biosynthesis protein RibF [Bacteroidota bacterium]
MHVHFSLEQIFEIPYPVVTMGSFDGVHAGHRVIISRLKTLAEKVGGHSVLITFHPHPRKVLYPESEGRELKLISTLREKICLLEETGLDHLVIMKFTREFANTSSQEFVEKYLVEMLHAHTIVVGFNHYFGHNKEGDFASLYGMREKFGFAVEEIPEQEVQHETVSSTKIRKALLEGNMQRANAYLEHHFMVLFEISSALRESEKHQRTCLRLGSDDPNKLMPPAGTYAVSFLSPGGIEKGLVIIARTGLLLFPLSDHGCPGPGMCPIHFHKRLSVNPGRAVLEQDLKTVRELIY